MAQLSLCYNRIFTLPDTHPFMSVHNMICEEFISRMNHARALLAATSLPVSEIASQCGYESNIYFSRHFKKKTGMTPSEYRSSQRITVSQASLPDKPAGKTEADRLLP